MKTISISSLKTNLSAELKHVRAGESLTVMDRNTPVAILSPIADPERPGAIPPRQQLDLTPPGIRLKTGALSLLAEDRKR